MMKLLKKNPILFVVFLIMALILIGHFIRQIITTVIIVIVLMVLYAVARHLFRRSK